ncbi:hypothetical protein BHE74_00005022 [Ensete ventricosum]|nr:hypothetical protein BHE74_00005022 [Ensete ventricosum]
MCVPGCSCLDVRLEMLLFGGSRGVLHEDLVGVGARPTWPLRRSSQCPDRGDLSVPNVERVFAESPPVPYPRVTFILAGLGTAAPGSLMLAASSTGSVIWRHAGRCLCWFLGPQSAGALSGRPCYARCRCGLLVPRCLRRAEVPEVTRLWG